MPWHFIAEPTRCAGIVDNYTNSRGRQRAKRCQTILWVGARFLLKDSKAYCETCAATLDQVNGKRQQINGATTGSVGYAMDRRHQADVDHQRRPKRSSAARRRGLLA